MILQHRPPGLLQLQEKRIRCVASLQQGNEGTRAHASHTHHFPRDVDDFVSFEQLAPVFLKGLPVGTELLLDGFLQLIGRYAKYAAKFPGRDQDRRGADDPVPAVHFLSQF